MGHIFLGDGADSVFEGVSVQLYISGKLQDDFYMEQFDYDVFISYSRKDYVDENKNVIPGNVISKIKQLLDGLKITYWFDEEGLYSGDEYAAIIAKSIKRSRVFLYVSSANSNVSEWTSNEIASAHAYKRKIIPFKIDDSLYHDTVMLYIAKLDYVDYLSNPEKGMKKLKKSILDYLEHHKREENRIKEESIKRENEEKKRIELDKQIKELSEKVEKSFVRINDLKTQLQIETSLLNSYNQRIAELMGNPQSAIQIEEEILEEKPFEERKKDRALVRLWKKIISNDGRERHPALSFFLNISFFFFVSISILLLVLFIMLTFTYPYKIGYYFIILNSFAILTLLIYLLKKWKRVSAYILILLNVIAFVGGFIVDQNNFFIALFAVVMLSIILTILFTKYKDKTYFSQTDKFVVCMKDRKGVWLPFAICVVYIVLSYCLLSLVKIQNSNEENMVEEEVIEEEVIEEEVIEEPIVEEAPVEEAPVEEWREEALAE